MWWRAAALLPVLIPRPHFGLGATSHIDFVEVHWPSGAVETLTAPAADRMYTVVEGHGIQ